MLKSKYGGHVAHLVKDMYPEHEWLEWKFVSVPSKLWAKEATRKKFMKWAGSQLGVNSMEDWYSITTRQIVELGGRCIHFTQFNVELGISAESGLLQGGQYCRATTPIHLSGA
jgi:hypothetical protein